MAHAEIVFAPTHKPLSKFSRAELEAELVGTRAIVASLQAWHDQQAAREVRMERRLDAALSAPEGK